VQRHRVYKDSQKTLPPRTEPAPSTSPDRRGALVPRFFGSKRTFDEATPTSRHALEGASACGGVALKEAGRIDENPGGRRAALERPSIQPNFFNSSRNAAIRTLPSASPAAVLMSTPMRRT
jgi:hypothetical protein